MATGYGKLGIGLVLIAAALGSAAGQAADAEVATARSLTLRQAVELALRLNPMIDATRLRREAALARMGEAKASRLPSLEFGETFTHSNNPVFAFGSLLEQGRFTERNFAIDSLNNPGSLSNFRSALNLRIPVFNRFQALAGIEQAKLGVSIAEDASERVVQQVRFQVLASYFAILVAEARREAALQAVETGEAERSRIADMVEQGILVSSDLLATEVQLAEFRQRLIQSEGEVATARAALNAALGEPIETAFDLLDELRERRFTLPAQSELIKRALDGRQDLAQSRRMVEIGEQKLRQARGGYWPDLNLFAQLGHSGQNWANGSADYAVGARLSFDVLDFGRSPRIREAEAEWTASKAELRQKSNQVGLEAVQAYRACLAAEQRLAVASGAVDQAAETLRIVRDRHGAGLTTITEVLRAQTALLDSQFNLLGARYDYTLGYARVLLASGALDDVNEFGS